jgi:hypothetical protein
MSEESNDSSKRNSMDSSSDRIVEEEEYHKANSTETKSTSFCLQLGGLKNAEAWEKITTRKEQNSSCTSTCSADFAVSACLVCSAFGCVRRVWCVL